MAKGSTGDKVPEEKVAEVITAELKVADEKVTNGEHN